MATDFWLTHAQLRNSIFGYTHPHCKFQLKWVHTRTSQLATAHPNLQLGIAHRKLHAQKLVFKECPKLGLGLSQGQYHSVIALLNK